MVGLELNRSKVSTDNTLGRASQRGWMRITGCKAPRQLSPETFPLRVGSEGCSRGKQEPAAA